MAAACPELLDAPAVFATPGAISPRLKHLRLIAPRPVRVEQVPTLTRPQARTYVALVVIWLASNVVFWSWWLQPQHIGAAWLYWLLSLALAYDATLLPSAYLFFVGRMRHPQPLSASPGLRVALATLCVPGAESHEVIRAQLEALVQVEYPHDSWVLDEGNDPAVRAFAASLGVRYFSRASIDRYNRAEPPFMAKTKAGNVNAWIDAHGTEYDFFTQLDIDHRPRPDYLDRVLGYFADPDVGWVQGPSLYANLDNWVARGAAEQELVLQGPLQRGFFGFSETPFIIGSHCTYRMRAIREIGGFQPTRAEDHLDSVMLAACGYRGVYLPEPIALGLGPDSFETYLRQQFAWAVSMIQVLTGYTPRLIGHLRPRQRLQFLFAETWYPLFALSALTLFTTPMLALLTGSGPAQASLFEFLVASLPMQLTALGVWWWSRRWHLPAGLGLSWRGLVLHVARWPIVLWALINVLLRVRHPYMITPKKALAGLPGVGLRSQAIYLAGVGISVAAVWLSVVVGADPSMRAYELFAVLGATYMLLVVATNVVANLVALRRLGLTWSRVARLRLVPVLGTLATLMIVGFTTLACAPFLVSQPSRVDQSASAEVAAVASDAWPQAMPAPDHEEAATIPSAPVESAINRQQPVLAAGRLSVGAFDPAGSMRDLPLTIDHRYVVQSDAPGFAEAFDRSGDRRIPLVTVEPVAPDSAEDHVLERVVAGETDAELVQLADIAREHPAQTVLIRWGHEMDLHLLYPWSSSDPALYRAAFRHVVDVFRAEGANNVRWVWSPAGEGNALAFYPGEDVVDYVGLTVLGDADWDAELGHQRRLSMADILLPRYRAIEPTGKPVIIAELGVSGTAAEQEAWLSEGARFVRDLPLVQAVVYFNASNAANNWRGSQPDWRLPDGQALGAWLSP